MTRLRSIFAAHGAAAARVVLIASSILPAAACGSGPHDPFAAPDTAFMTVVEGLQEQRPEVIWEALPASYQQDITDLIHEFAATIDSDVYDRSFSILGKAATVLEAKKELMLASGMLDRPGVPSERTAAGVDAAAQLLQTLAGSDLASIETLKTLDPSATLGSTGSRLMVLAAEVSRLMANDPYETQFTQNLAKTTVELVSSRVDTAVVRVQLPYQLPEEQPMVRVDDRWVPVEMAAQWPELIQSARAQLSRLEGEEFTAKKPQVMMVLGMVEVALDQVAAAETQEQLVAAQQAILGIIVAASMG